MSKTLPLIKSFLKATWFAAVTGFLFYFLLSNYMTAKLIYFNQGHETGYKKCYDENKYKRTIYQGVLSNEESSS